MPKNIFIMSFLYVFIACAMFIANTVHSASNRSEWAANGLDHGFDRQVIGRNLDQAYPAWFRY